MAREMPEERQRHHAARRAETMNLATIEFAQQAIGPVDLLELLVEIEPLEMRMAVAVIADQMPFGDDARDEIGMTLDALADQKEDRARAVLGEEMEHLRRVLRFRAVVEGEIR